MFFAVLFQGLMCRCWSVLEKVWAGIFCYSRRTKFQSPMFWKNWDEAQSVFCLLRPRLLLNLQKKLH